MDDYRYIQELIDGYFEGLTSLKEEEKLREYFPWKKPKRYQFEFEIQDNPIHSDHPRREGEIRSRFVPVG